MRFYSQEHDVEGAADSIRVNEVTVLDDRHLTIRSNHSETIASQFSEAQPAVYECHGVTTVRECST